MQVGARRTARVPAEGHAVPALHLVPDLRVEVAEVAVARLVAEAVVYHHEIAVAIVFLCHRDHSVSRGEDRRSRRAGQVYARVAVTPCAPHRVDAVAEGTRIAEIALGRAQRAYRRDALCNLARPCGNMLHFVEGAALYHGFLQQPVQLPGLGSQPGVLLVQGRVAVDSRDSGLPQGGRDFSQTEEDAVNLVIPHRHVLQRGLTGFHSLGQQFETGLPRGIAHLQHAGFRQVHIQPGGGAEDIEHENQQAEHNNQGSTAQMPCRGDRFRFVGERSGVEPVSFRLPHPCKYTESSKKS